MTGVRRIPGRGNATTIVSSGARLGGAVPSRLPPGSVSAMPPVGRGRRRTGDAAVRMRLGMRADEAEASGVLLRAATSAPAVDGTTLARPKRPNGCSAHHGYERGDSSRRSARSSDGTGIELLPSVRHDAVLMRRFRISSLVRRRALSGRVSGASIGPSGSFATTSERFAASVCSTGESAGADATRSTSACEAITGADETSELVDLLMGGCHAPATPPDLLIRAVLLHDGSGGLGRGSIPGSRRWPATTGRSAPGGAAARSGAVAARDSGAGDEETRMSTIRESDADEGGLARTEPLLCPSFQTTL